MPPAETPVMSAGPAAHRLIRNHYPALSQQVLDIAKAEAEPAIEPNGLLDDHGWKAISGVADLGHNGRLPAGITADKPHQRDKALLSHRKLPALFAEIEVGATAVALRQTVRLLRDAQLISREGSAAITHGY